MHAVDERGDVDVDDVAVQQLAAVGDAVADDLVDRGAQRLGEVAVVEGARVGAAGDAGLVADAVELVGGDAGGDGLADLDQHLGRDAAGDAHALDLVGRANGARRPRVDGWPVSGVLGPGDAGGHGAAGAQQARAHRGRGRRFEEASRRCLRFAIVRPADVGWSEVDVASLGPDSLVEDEPVSVPRSSESPSDAGEVELDDGPSTRSRGGRRSTSRATTSWSFDAAAAVGLVEAASP